MICLLGFSTFLHFFIVRTKAMVKNTEKKKTKKLPNSPSSQIFSCLSYLPILILYNVFFMYFSA